MTDQTIINQQLAAHAKTATTGGDPNQSISPDKVLMKDLISYIQLSSMQQKEKAMWLLLLPSMEEKHLLKLKNSLQKEVNQITDLYINALSKRA